LATVRKFELKDLDRQAAHDDVATTVSLIEVNGEKMIQIDTYGSANRQMPGKVSQSLRLTKDVFDRLSELAQKHF
jgi:predicted RNA-binding protein